MAVTPKNTMFKVKYIIRGCGKSWTETWCLGVINRATAVINGGYVVAARRLIMAEPFQILKASIHLMDATRDRSSVIVNPVGPLNLDTEAGPPIAVEETNDAKSVLMVYGETPLGLWVNRPIGAIRDTWITANVSQITPTIYVAPMVPATHLVAGQTAAVALGSFLGVLRDFVKLARKIPGDNANLDLFDLPNWSIAGVSSHDRGGSAGSGRGRQRVLANM